MQSNDGAVLSNKNALLSTQGQALDDSYYSVQNSSVSLVETTYGWPNLISMSSMTFGSQSSVQIPIDQFVSHVVLHLQIQKASGDSVLCPLAYLTQGWGYAALAQIGFTLGASATTTVYLQGDSILQQVMAECDSAEKRSEILYLGGPPVLKGIPGVGLSGPTTTVADAYVLIPLPFSSACDKLPFDTTLLSNNITLQIQFNPITSFIAGQTIPAITQFTKAEVMLHQGKLSNQAQSLRQAMVANPLKKQAYPFIHAASFVSPQFDGSTSISAKCQVQLNTFANADLVGIVFWVVKAIDKSPPNDASDSYSLNPYNCDPITDLLVLFNGSNLFNLPAQSYKLTGMLSHYQMASWFSCPVISTASNNPSAVISMEYPIYLDFSRNRAACEGDHLYNTFRIPNQVLQLSFNTSGTGKYQLYATYFYNAVAELQNGTSAINIA